MDKKEDKIFSVSLSILTSVYALLYSQEIDIGLLFLSFGQDRDWIMFSDNHLI